MLKDKEKIKYGLSLFMDDYECEVFLTNISQFVLGKDKDSEPYKNKKELLFSLEKLSEEVRNSVLLEMK